MHHAFSRAKPVESPTMPIAEQILVCLDFLGNDPCTGQQNAGSSVYTGDLGPVEADQLTRAYRHWIDPE